MKIVSTLVLFLTLFNGFSQSISGKWNWQGKGGYHMSEITIEYINDHTIKGNYCSSFFNGNKIDCNKNPEDFYIQMFSVSKNIYHGTFKSSFSGEIGKIRITYNKNENTLFLEILKKPESEYYLPDNVIFKR